MKRFPLWMGVVALLFVGLLVATPQERSWAPDYRPTSDAPLGAAVLHGLFGAWTGASVEVVAETPYLRLADTTAAADGVLYVFLTQTFAPDPSETRRLMAFARHGGTVFIAAETLDGDLAETLAPPPDSLNRANDWAPEVQMRPLFGESGDSLLRLDAPAMVRTDGYRFPIAVRSNVLSHLDTTRTARLGRDAQGSPTLVRVAVGRGAVVLSSTPRAFSNAALTGDGDAAAYVGGVLGHLTARRVLWDAHHTPLGTSRSPLGLVFATPPLKWAYTLLLLGTLLFVVFRGRRWQRAVPVVTPPPNALVAFAESVGQLQAQHGDRAALVARRQAAFFDTLRARAGIANPDLSDDTEALVARAVGDETAALVFTALRRTAGWLPPKADRLADDLRSARRRTRSPGPGDHDLLALDRALDRAYAALGR